MFWDILKSFFLDSLSGEKAYGIIVICVFLFSFFLYKALVYMFDQIRKDSSRNRSEDMELIDKIITLHDKISGLREEFQNETAKTEDVKSLAQNQRALELEVSKIKGHLGLD